MRLRRQLILVSLLTLSLPWAGCQYIQEMEAALRQGQVVALGATAQAVASRIGSEPELAELLGSPRWQAPSDDQFYVHTLDSLTSLDGYDDDWRYYTIANRTFSDPQSPAKLSLRLARYQENLAIFAAVDDPHIRYHNPSTGELASGDHLRLRTTLTDGSVRDYVIRTGAPGEVLAFYRDQRQRIRTEPRIRGHWQEHASGFQVELTMPMSLMSDRLGVALVDVLRPLERTPLGDTQSHARWLGNISASGAPPFWVGQETSLAQAISVFARADLRLRVVSRNQWLLADEGRVKPAQHYASEQHGLLTWLYRLALGNPFLPAWASENDSGQFVAPEVLAVQLPTSGPQSWASGWYQWGSQRVGRAAVAVSNDSTGNNDTAGNGALAVVVVEQSSDSMIALTNTAFSRLFFYTVLATLVTGAGLLSYASWLSFRIRRLSVAAQQALDENGRIVDDFPQSTAGDEVGDLTRNYAKLLDRLREYTDYLQTLSSKLSHELRTPLAVVRTSLDNLEHETLPESARVYAQRAQDGSARLSSILNAMSAASRVEESIKHSEVESVALADLIVELGQAYADVVAGCKVSVDIDARVGRGELMASPELLVQMLDKLVDNAADFCPSDGAIVLRLLPARDGFLLVVGNDGPLLPERMQDQLFDSLVSLRSGDQGSSQTHLGLGLHIVRLIAQYHGGAVVARNRDDLSGVEFEVLLPFRVIIH